MTEGQSIYQASEAVTELTPIPFVKYFNMILFLAWIQRKTHLDLILSVILIYKFYLTLLCNPKTRQHYDTYMLGLEFLV